MSRGAQVAAFTFNGHYDNEEQVAEYLPAFLAVLAEIESAGQYRYNDSFKGRIPGIEGPDEDTAIYLLQGLERSRRQAEKVAALVADGYEHVEHISEPIRCAHIVLYPTSRTGGEWYESRDARLVPSPYAHGNNLADVPNDYPHGVIPKGKRTHGHLVMGRRVLIKRSA